MYQYIAAYQGVLLLFSGLEHGRSLPWDPPQPPPVFSMLGSQTCSPGYEGEEEGDRAHSCMSKQHASSLSHKSVHGEGQGYLIH